MITVDLNCDMGEGMPHDEELMLFISSANIACGFHAGDESIMKKTVELALANNVAIGAHPGFADKENFGRLAQHLSAQECYSLIVEQLAILKKITDEFNTIIHHVKPHGALYNMAAKDKSLACIIATAVKNFDSNLVLYGLSGSHSIREAEAINLQTANEAFADRTYTDEGTLTPRSQPAALIENDATALAQVIKMIKNQTVISINNKAVPVMADTICIHGDGAHAVQFARLIHSSLKENDIVIRAK